MWGVHLQVHLRSFKDLKWNYSVAAALRAGAASVCLLSMTFLLGASRLALFTFEIHASIRWNWDPSSAWVASVSGVD